MEELQSFKPLDVEATIPALSVAAEASRQVIRDSDAIVQTDVDAADEAALKFMRGVMGVIMVQIIGVVQKLDHVTEL